MPKRKQDILLHPRNRLKERCHPGGILMGFQQFEVLRSEKDPWKGLPPELWDRIEVPQRYGSRKLETAWSLLVQSRSIRNFYFPGFLDGLWRLKSNSVWKISERGVGTRVMNNSSTSATVPVYPHTEKKRKFEILFECVSPHPLI